MIGQTKAFSHILARMSRRLFPVRGMAAATMLVLVIGGVGFLSIEYLKRDTARVVGDSLAGVSEANIVNANVVESLNRTLLLLMTTNQELGQTFEAQIKGYNMKVAKALSIYAGSIYSRADVKLYNELMEDRRRFLSLQMQVSALNHEGQGEEARKLFKTDLFPSYLQYKANAQQLVRFNADEGHQRSAAIVNFCNVMQMVIAGTGVLLFLAGFLIGFLK